MVYIYGTVFYLLIVVWIAPPLLINVSDRLPQPLAAVVPFYVSMVVLFGSGIFWRFYKGKSERLQRWVAIGVFYLVTAGS